MKNQIKKQEIAQLLSKFMAGETSVAEEEVLAQYFRTHEVDDEWAEYKEMFAQLNNTDSEKIKMLPKAVKGKPKIVALRWMMVGIAASVVLLVAFHLGRSTAEQPSLVAEKTVATKDSVQLAPKAIIPTATTAQTIVAHATPAKRPTAQQPNAPTVDSASAAEDLAKCIARLESEMEKLDDSVGSAQVERLIAADVRLQLMVNRIVGKQVEQAINEIKKDTTTNYISF